MQSIFFIALGIIGFFLGIFYDYIASNIANQNITKKNQVINKESLLIGLITAVFFIFFHFSFQFNYEFWIGIIISSLLLIIFISDLKYMIILDIPLIISGILIFIIKSIFYGLMAGLTALLNGFFLFLFILIIYYISTKIFKRETLGGGDMKLCIIIGMILDVLLGIISLALSTFLALPYAVFNLLNNNEHELPYGPFLISALWLVFLYLDKFTALLNFFFIK